MAQSKKWTQPAAFRFHQRKGCKNQVHCPGRKRMRLGWGVSMQVWKWAEHTCWLKSILRTESALSFLETTAWFGTMPRWQFWASVTGFLVPSRHSSSKSFCFRFLAQSSVFFPGERETRTTYSFHQDAPLGRYDQPPMSQRITETQRNNKALKIKTEEKCS